jgi:hypothetical protein
MQNPQRNGHALLGCGAYMLPHGLRRILAQPLP